MTDEEQKRFDWLARQLDACDASRQHLQEVNKQLSEKLDQVNKTNNNFLQFIKDKGLDPPA